MLLRVLGLSFSNEVVVLARGIEASYRSSADSPTALGKGANERKVDLAPFSNGVLPK
jgi:hypothetical protein